MGTRRRLGLGVRGCSREIGRHLDCVVPLRMQNQLADRVQSKLAHDVAAVGFGGLDSQALLDLVGARWDGRPA